MNVIDSNNPKESGIIRRYGFFWRKFVTVKVGFAVSYMLKITLRPLPVAYKMWDSQLLL